MLATQNFALQPWGKKDLRWEKRDLFSEMQTICGPIFEILRTSSRYFNINSKRSSKKHVVTTSHISRQEWVMGMLFIMITTDANSNLCISVLPSPLFSISLKLFSSFFHIFMGTFLPFYGKWDRWSKMRPECGPFKQFGPHADKVCNWRPGRKHCNCIFIHWNSGKNLVSTNRVLAVDVEGNVMKLSGTSQLPEQDGA